MRVLTIRLPEKTVKKLDELVEQFDFNSRSDVVRFIISFFLMFFDNIRGEKN